MISAAPSCNDASLCLIEHFSSLLYLNFIKFKYKSLLKCSIRHRHKGALHDGAADISFDYRSYFKLIYSLFSMNVRW